MIRVGPNEQTARNFHALERAPVLESIVDRNAEILLTNGKQHWCLEIHRAAYRILLFPDCRLVPWRNTGHQFTMGDAVARPALVLAVQESGRADEAWVSSRCCFEPIRQMTAIARARSALPGAVDEIESPNGFVCRFVQFACRSGEWIALNGAGKL